MVVHQHNRECAADDRRTETLQRMARHHEADQYPDRHYVVPLHLFAGIEEDHDQALALRVELR